MQKNKIERLKSSCIPYAFRERIDRLDLSNLSEEDRFYLKNYGIYNSKLRPEYFMLRIRVKGGRIDPEKLSFIHMLAEKYGLEILLTARAQLELHGVSANQVLEVWQALLDAGITTLQTLTDNFRNIVTDPYDGENIQNHIEVYALIEAMESLFLDDPEWMGMLPRKFNTAISGTAAQFTHFFGNDLFFALARKEGIYGFNLYLGGKNSETARSADLFIPPENVPAMFEAVARAYRKIGLRGTRAKTRLYHLLEAVGMEVFLKEVRHFYPFSMERAGELLIAKAPFQAFTPLREERWGYCLRSTFGKIDLERLEKLIAFARQEELEIRLGIDQNIHLLGLKTPKVPWEGVAGAAHVTACAGSSYCGLSLWDIKSETAYLPLARIESHQIQVGFSGCLKGCGRHHHCDIGLVGLRTNLFGQTQKAARLFLGGQYSSGSASARLIFPSVPLPHLTALIEKIIDTYEESGEEDFEHFTKVYLNPHTTFFVMLWFLAQLYLQQPPKLTQESETVLYGRLTACEDFPVFEDDEEYLQSIKVMMHALWDDEEVNDE
jgi:ferredoxin-nitrite reductase